MRKLVVGSERDTILEGLENKEVYGPDEDFKFTGWFFNDSYPVYVIFQVDQLSKKKIDQILESKYDFILLSRTEEGVNDKILEEFEIEERGKINSFKDFFEKLDPLIYEFEEFEEIEDLQDVPMEYILERLNHISINFIGSQIDDIEMVNRNLYNANREMLYHYLALNVDLPARDSFYRSNTETQMNKLLEQIEEKSSLSKQEARRNLRTVVEEEDIELSETQRGVVYGS